MRVVMSGSNGQELFHAFLSMCKNACRVYREGRPFALNMSQIYFFSGFLLFTCACSAQWAHI